MAASSDANLAHQRPAIYVRVITRHSAVLRDQGCVCFQQQLPAKLVFSKLQWDSVTSSSFVDGKLHVKQLVSKHSNRH